MNGLRFRRRERGFSLIETAVSGFVLAISVAGLVVSVAYGRQLERSTANTWRATSAATATLEQIRSDSMGKWSGVPTGWDAHVCSDSGFGGPIADKMVASVGTDEAALDAPRGMWTAGATAPNFYFVKVVPGTNGAELSKSLQFQTYVANRGASGAGTSPVATGGSAGLLASKLTTTPASLVLSNVNKRATFTLTNSSSTPLAVTMVAAVGSTGVKIKTLNINSTTLYSNANGSAILSVANANGSGLLPSGLASGPVNVSFTGNATLANKTLTLAITFSDNSVATIVVQP